MSGDEYLEHKLNNRSSIKSFKSFLSNLCPKVISVVVDKRASIIAKRLRNCRGTIVGVVPIGFLDEIESHWNALSVQHLQLPSELLKKNKEM